MRLHANAARRFSDLHHSAASVAIAAALGVTASGPMAAIVDSGPIAIDVPAALDGIYVNAVTGLSATTAPFPAGWDFNPYATAGGTTLDFYTSADAANSSQVVGIVDLVTPLGPGATVGPASGYALQGVVSTRNTTFRATATSYIGVRFNNEATGAMNYGYAQVQTTAPLGFPATIVRVVYDDAGAAITTPGIAPPAFQGAVSRHTHGSAGTFDLALSTILPPAVNHNPTTEARRGPAQSVVFTFNNPLTGASATVSEGAAIASAPVISGNTVTVDLSGVADGQYVTIDLTNVSDTTGGVGGSASVRVGFLAGDVDQTRAVTIADLAFVNAQLSQPVTAANFPLDVNASGTLTLADKGLTNAALTHSLPIP